MPNPTPKYLDPTRVKGIIVTPCAPNPYRTGYGLKIPTGYLMQLNDLRWRRVYVMCWSNSGSAYVRIGGVPHLLGAYDPRAVLKGASSYGVTP